MTGLTVRSTAQATSAANNETVASELSAVAAGSPSEADNQIRGAFGDPSAAEIFRIFGMYKHKAFAGHVASDHRRRHAVGGAMPLLMERLHSMHSSLGDRT